MRKQTLAILSIIALGSVVSIAYATSTVISDAGITTPSLNATNINVSGTCTGCGGISEGNYNSYSMIYNVTLNRFVNTNNYLLVNNTGFTFFGDSNQGLLYLFNPSGSLLLNDTTFGNFINSALVNSINNKYIIGEYEPGNGTVGVSIWKNTNLLHVIANSHYTSLASISLNGQYIGVWHNDPSNHEEWLSVWKGS